MIDMTAEARARSIMICSCPPASREPKIHIFSCLGSQRKSVADQIRQAEAAARRKALDDAEEVANTFYYGNDIKAAIRELNGKSGNKEIAEWNEHDTIYI